MPTELFGLLFLVRDVAQALLKGCDSAQPLHLVGFVEPVAGVALDRQSARTVVEAWPSLPDGPALTTLVEMAFALGGRREGGWLARRVEVGLRGLPAQWLEPLLTARDRRVRRTAYRTAIAAGGLGQDRLMAAAVRGGDLPIRTMCAQAAVGEADSAQLRRLLASRTAVVRAEALQALSLSEQRADH